MVPADEIVSNGISVAAVDGKIIHCEPGDKNSHSWRCGVLDKWEP